MGNRPETVLKGVNLYLIGMMGSGKSTIGQLVAEQIGYQFFDTDRLIEQATGQSISHLFAEQGEPQFRQLETEVLGQLSAYTRLTIATGGGIVLTPMNWSYLRHGIVVWLDVPVDRLYDRLLQDTTRPLLQTADLRDTLQTLLSQRRSLYTQADLCIQPMADESPQAIASRILAELPTVLKPSPSS